MKILIIDIESTGFLKAKGKIVEVGIVELNLKTGEKKILFDSVVHERPITKKEIEKSWIIKNSSLTLDDVKFSPQLKDKKEEIQGIVNKYPLGATAYNNDFDFNFLEDRGIVFPCKLPCPMKLSRTICNAKNKNGNIKNPNVQEAYDFFFPKNNYIEKHRGADDAFHEADIVHELYKMGVFRFESESVTTRTHDKLELPKGVTFLEVYESINDNRKYKIPYLSPHQNDSGEFRYGKFELEGKFLTPNQSLGVFLGRWENIK